VQVVLQGRVGVHSGAVMVAFVGHIAPRLLAFGPDVATTQRLEATGPPGRVHVSSTTVALLSPATVAAAGGGLEGPLHIEWPAAAFAAIESFLLPAGAFEYAVAGSTSGDWSSCVGRVDKASATTFGGCSQESAEQETVAAEERIAAAGENAAAEMEESNARDEMHKVVNGLIGPGPHALLLVAVAAAAAVQAVAALIRLDSVDRLCWFHNLVVTAESVDHCTCSTTEVPIYYT
jgi:hypothetical protein